MSVETELKLTLSPETARKLVKSKLWKPLRVGGVRRRHLVNTYFDTPHFILRRCGMALRIRDDGKSREQTLKLPAAGPAGLQNYEEWTMPVSGDRPQLESLTSAGSAAFLAEPDTTRRIRPVFTTEFDRTTMLLRREDAEVELAVDVGAIRADRKGSLRQEAICELELELVSGDAGALSEIALTICEHWDAMPAHRTKAERGYALARASLRPKPRKPQAVDLRPNMTAGEAFESIAATSLRHLFENRAPTLRGKAEGIHQTRVALRRLRAALRAFSGLLPYHERKAFSGELRWFQQRLSPARDWHVFLTETLPHIAASAPHREKELHVLRRLAVRERRRATASAREELLSRRYARLVLQFQRWVAGLEQTVPAEKWQRPLVPYARVVLRKSRADLMRESRGLTRLSAEELHELRKSGKKARYASEFFSSLWASSETEPYLQLMEGLQDCLGEANDAGVAGRLLLSLRPGRVETGLLELVQTDSERRFRDAISAARRPWKRLRSAQPFWLARASVN